MRALSTRQRLLNGLSKDHWNDAPDIRRNGAMRASIVWFATSLQIGLNRMLNRRRGRQRLLRGGMLWAAWNSSL
jgi:hypothetical protein